MISTIKTGQSVLRTILIQQQNKINIQLCRYSGYYNSPDASTFKSTVADYDVSKSKEEWKYVERLLPPTTVPNIIPRELYNSQWKPPTAKPTDHKYFINRNRNHMLPVYLNITYRGMRKVTEVHKIHGDIYEMQKDLNNLIESTTGKPVGSQVNELVGVITFKGDFVSLIKKYLMEKGF